LEAEAAKAPPVASAAAPVAVSSQPAAGVPAVKAVDDKVAPQPASAALTLAENGTTAYEIVTGAQPLMAEQTAAKELAEYLKKVTGAEFKTVAESATEPKPAKAIYLGWTAFAASQGIDGTKLGVEESVIKTVGDSLVITGGRTRGTLYGVYDFLQKDLGVYWLDRSTEVVPKRPMLALAAIDRRAKPVFRLRYLDPYWWLVFYDRSGWLDSRFRLPASELGVRTGARGIV